MKYLKMEDINIESMELFHVNRNHYNSKIYYKQDIYTTIFNKPVELYNMFIKHEKYIRFFSPGIISLIEEQNKLKGYQMRKGKTISTTEVVNYVNKNKQKLIEFMEDSGYYYCDWRGSNMILIDNTISLIDLDSFFPIKKINNPYWNLKIKWYIEKVDEIAKLIE